MVRTFQSVMVERKKKQRCCCSSVVRRCTSLNDTTKPHHETDELKLEFWHKRAPYIIGKVTGEYNVNLLRENGL